MGHASCYLLLRENCFYFYYRIFVLYICLVCNLYCIFFCTLNQSDQGVQCDAPWIVFREFDTHCFAKIADLKLS